MSDEHKRKISESHKGKTHTEETKRKLSNQRKDAGYRQRQRELRSTEDHKRKLEDGQRSEAMLREKAKRQTAEYKEAARQRRLGISHTPSRKREILLTMLIKMLARVDAGERVGIALDHRSSTKPWIARIRYNGKPTYIGAFATELEAQQAYRNRLVAIIEYNQASESEADESTQMLLDN